MVFSIIFAVFLLIHVNVALSAHQALGQERCINMWDEGCVNGQLPGAGRDDEFINGGFNPGKRCADPGRPGCSGDDRLADDKLLALRDRLDYLRARLHQQPRLSTARSEYH